MANAKFSAIVFKLSLKRTMKDHKERAKQMAKGEESGFRSAKPKKMIQFKILILCLRNTSYEDLDCLYRIPFDIC